MKYDEIRNRFDQHGYSFFDNGAYNVNLYGIRSGYNVVNEYDDILGICFRDDFNNEVCIESRGTTKPGLHWLKNEIGGLNGTFILQPGQYRSCWTFGKHRSTYDALIQKSTARFKGWRDSDNDGQLDIGGEIFDDVTGLNMHTTSLINDVDKVNKYSAGCQVRQKDEDHWIVMEILQRSAEIYGVSFSYTLFEAS